MKVNCDLQLTLMASSLYRLLGDAHRPTATNAAKSRTCSGTSSTPRPRSTSARTAITVRFQKRAHNPLLLAAGFDKKPTSAIPWLDNRTLHLLFG